MLVPKEEVLDEDQKDIKFHDISSENSKEPYKIMTNNK
jgi:hypothetical protein